MKADRQVQSSSGIKNHIKVRSALHERGSKLTNVWFHESPKNKKRIVIYGDLVFMHAILLEANHKVTHYEANPDPIRVYEDGEEVIVKPHLHVHFTNKKDEFWRVSRGEKVEQDSVGRRKLQQLQNNGLLTKQICDISEKVIDGKEILFDNWVCLCAIINRAKHLSKYHEIQELERLLALNRSVTVQSLVSLPNSDPALMLAAIAGLLQEGILTTELQRTLFGTHSILSWSTP